MFFVFVLFGAYTIYFSKTIHNTYINPFTVLCAPYLFVVIINKAYGEKIGFYPIGNMTLTVIGAGLLCFFIGTLIALRKDSVFLKDYVDSDNSEKLDNYKMKPMLYYSFFVAVIGLMKAALIVKGMGLYGLTKEGSLISGPVGHLVFTAYPLQPFLFYYWLKNKTQKSYLFVFVLYLVVLFCSFVKYHLIGMIVICYLFVVLTERKYLRKGAVILISIVAGVFVLNYVVDFISNNVYNTVQSSFYLNHLFKYICGAVINGDRYYLGMIGGVADTGYKLMTFLFGLPNMFIYALFRTKLFPFESIQMTSVSYIGEKSNVIDAISYMYSGKAGIIGNIEFAVFFLIFGFIMEVIFIKNIYNEENLQIFIATVLTFFLFFSFFGTFYINSMPWEIAVYSAIVPSLFSYYAKVEFVV